MWWTQHRIILASKSPRRSQLLQQAGLPFVVKTMEVEESFPDDLDKRKVAGFLARKKGRAAKSFLESNLDIILTADSIVLLDDRIYGKPTDRADAVRILQALSGKVHEVITGVCLLTTQQERVFSDVAAVQFEVLSQAEIDYYIDHYQPFDKAGSYAIQEWIGLCKISSIEGTYANIMGLPVEKVYKELKKLIEEKG